MPKKATVFANVDHSVQEIRILSKFLSQDRLDLGQVVLTFAQQRSNGRLGRCVHGRPQIARRYAQQRTPGIIRVSRQWLRS